MPQPSPSDPALRAWRDAIVDQQTPIHDMPTPELSPEPPAPKNSPRTREMGPSTVAVAAANDLIEAAQAVANERTDTEEGLEEFKDSQPEPPPKPPAVKKAAKKARPAPKKRTRRLP